MKVIARRLPPGLGTGAEAGREWIETATAAVLIHPDVVPDGLALGTQVVGRGDEIVTTRNDRRLVTTGGLWVRDGDRWQVDGRRGDGALVASPLDGLGRVVLPAGYAAEHVALAYAVTVHKAEGLTVDRAVLLADNATTGEHLYVGMSRGRHDNQVCVVTDAAATGHGHQAPATPVEVLTAALRRSSAERSATETLRDELDRSEDRDTLRRLREHAVAHIERCAGPDRRPELRRLQQLEASLPMKGKILTVHQRDVVRLDQRIAAARRSLSDRQTDLDILTRRRRFRRHDHPAIDDAHRRIDAQQRELEGLQRERTRVAADLERNRRTFRESERTVSRIPDVQAAIQYRRQWFLTHPAELAWEADLAVRLAETAKTADPPAPEQEQHPGDLDALLETLDLRTIDLSPTRRRTAFERRLGDAIGLSRPDDSLDNLLRPPPERGIDGPDLGLGLGLGL